ncbi:MAG: CRISPR-associated endonuclease Cas1 [Bacteroidota bacterium]
MDLHLTSYGAKIRVRQGLFAVKYFDEEMILHRKEYAPSELDCIWLYPPTSLSVEVIKLAAQHEIEIIFVGERDMPMGRYSSYVPRGSSKVAKAQFIVSVSPKLSFPVVKDLLLRKINSQADFLRKVAKRSKKENGELLFYLDAIEDSFQKMQAMEGILDDAMKQSLRGIEGTSSRNFYAAINTTLLPRYRFNGRSRRPVKDAFNAFLNYAFALLYTEVERALVRAGIQPIIGLMHREGYQLKSMVYDFIEPFRADTVWVVYQLFVRERISLQEHVSDLGARVDVAREGKRLLIPTWNKYYKERRTKAFGMNLIRNEIIKREAELLATRLLKISKLASYESLDYV